MSGYVITFFVITLMSGVLGFGVFAGTMATAAKVVCGCFAVLLVLAVIRGTEPINPHPARRTSPRFRPAQTEPLPR